jgi:hypothetical protein
VATHTGEQTKIDAHSLSFSHLGRDVARKHEGVDTSADNNKSKDVSHEIMMRLPSQILAFVVID